MNSYNTINLSNYDSNTKAERLNEAFSLIESDLELVGISGIEDQLQEGVPETIELLINASIRVWVLTGDKKETALNIAKTSRLIEEIHKNELDLTAKICRSQFELETRLDAFIDKFHLYNIQEIKERKLEDRYYCIVDGESLITILKDFSLRYKFFKVGLICRSVICCRVSPKQKSEVVILCKTLSESICLSIGDGANDVPMIMEANIGVGISGKEGTSAVRSADYAFGQFKHLQRLILIHGRNGYKRVATFICYYFYKNIILVFAELSFVMINGFSGQPFYPSILPILYNSLWTSWPSLFAFGLERDVVEVPSKSTKNILGFNYQVMFKLYPAGQKDHFLNFWVFWKWVTFSILHGIICYYTISFGFSYGKEDGKIPSHWVSSTIVFSLIIQVVTYKLFVETVFWNLITISISILSITFYYLCLYVISLPAVGFNFQNELAFKSPELLQNKYFWFVLLVVPLMAIIPDIAYRFFQLYITPNLADYIHRGDIQTLANFPSAKTLEESEKSFFRKISKIVDPRRNFLSMNSLKKSRASGTEVELADRNFTIKTDTQEVLDKDSD